MRLSERAQRALEEEVRRFMQALMVILEPEAKRRAAHILHGVLNGIGSEGIATPTAPGSSQPAGTARRRGGGRGVSSVEELVEVLRAAGGRAKPRDLGKALGLTAQRRFHLATEAAARGLVRMTGKTASTVYILVE